MAAYVHDSQFITRRTVVLFAIVALHVFIAWALATGLARRAIELVAPPLQTTVVDEVVKRDEPPPPPPPQLERPPVEVPPPDVAIEVPIEPTSTAIVDTTDKPVLRAPPPAATHQAVIVGGGPGKNFPSTDDYYPSASARLGESGTATVHVCTDAKGKLTEDPKISETSGTPRLDDGALKLAKAASGRYKPATSDGNPIPACFGFRIKFQLRN